MNSSLHTSKHTSVESLKETIKNDRQICRWFTFLITRPVFRKDFASKPSLQEDYKMLDKIFLIQKFTAVCFLGSLAMIVVFKSAVWIGICFVSYGCHEFLSYRMKKHVMAVGLDVILQDFELSVLTGKTLFELGEFYGKKYGVPTIVDALIKEDDFLRILLIGIYIYVFCIFPYFGFVKAIIAFITLYFILKFILNQDAVYRFFK